MIGGRRKSILRKIEHEQEILLQIKTIRRAKRSDIPKVEYIITLKSKHIFGDVNVGDIICKSFISAVMINENNDIIGCMCVNNFPNVPSVPPWYWRTWLVNIYKLNYITPRNSLWVHLCVAIPGAELVFVHKVLIYLYKKCHFVHHILFVVPPGPKDIDWLEPNGIYVSPQGHGNARKLQNVFLTIRHDFMTYYKVRRAVEQDNDDVVALINRHTGRVKKMYGEFYISELIIEKRNNNRQVIVAEYAATPVAVMILNDTVNYDILNHAFKLETFYGLRKPDPHDDTKVFESEHEHEDETHNLEDIAHLSKMSFGDIPEHLTHSDIRIPGLEPSKCSSENSFSMNFELPKDVEVDIMMKEKESESEICDDSEQFVGTLEDQVGCVILSYTDEEYDKWTKKRNFCGSISRADVNAYHPKIPSYFGEDNAFVLEVVAAHPDHEQALWFLLEAAYECFPTRNYIVLCIPSNDFTFPLLKLFVRVTPRPSSNFANELYVMHRAAISSSIAVREASHFDYPYVESLLKNIKSIYKEFYESVTMMDSKLRSYTFTSDGRVVGFAVLSEQQDIEYINSHYQISTWTDMIKHKIGCHGAINHFVVSPIFYVHSRFFLQELHRLSDYSILYYKIEPEELQPRHNTLACILGSLLPVVPASLPENDVSETEYWKLPDVLRVSAEPYALYISTPLHCGLSRWEVNTKIVVVGASDVALAFLVELIFKNNPNYRVIFNNITLVSPHGISRNRTNRIREILLPSRSNLHGQYFNLLSLRTYVNVVSGVMSAINRKEKTITVNSSFLPYDLLFLTCGRQYQMPQRSKDLRGTTSEFPQNVFIINTEIDADIALMKLNKLIVDSGLYKYTVIVYGHNLATVSCIAALLEFGIPSQNLVFVEPLPEGDDSYEHSLIFDDSDVEEAVMAEINNLGIETLCGYHFLDWIFDKELDGITSVIFGSQYKIKEIACIGMFAYCDKMISMRTFLAINRAGLVFDGGLVVGPNCQTNDPNIYAAGSITKYPRRYYADHKKHQYYNQEEIGRKLAELISAKLFRDQGYGVQDTLISVCTDSSKMLVPQYNDPLVEYAVLPGNLYYLNVKKPGIPVPQDVAMTAEDYGQVLMSGNCKLLESQGYFRLHLNQGNVIETITCLAKFPLQTVNLTCLWGKHERLLNNLVQRFEMVLITDLFEFFKQEWTTVIYHDNYKKITADMNNIIQKLTDEEGNSLIEDICQKLQKNNWKSLTPQQYKELKHNFLASQYSEEVLKKLLNFFSDHMLYLPMYAHPLIVSMILGGYEESSFFKNI